MICKSLITIILICFHIASGAPTSKILFWENQQKVANYFNAVPTREWFESAAAANIKFVRHPAMVGYNIQNEPHPEIFNGKNSFWKNDLPEWYETIKGTPGDLNLFYKKVVASIREVDKTTPIVVSPGLYATPWCFSYLEKIDDPNVVYSFHVYEPYQYTTLRLNDGKYRYPGKVPVDNDLPLEFDMNKTTMAGYLKPVSDWARKNDVPSNRIWAGEFGCSRKVKGVEKYLSDLIEIFNENQWHWSFYSYREDVWENMDYELGTGVIPQKYWEYSSEKTLHHHYSEIYGQVKNNLIWPVFQKEFSK